MASRYQLSATLYQWAKDDAQKQAKLRTWLDNAVEHIAQGQGSHIVSATANGITFNSVAQMTNADWAAVLSQALTLIDNGTAPVSTAQGVIR